MGVTTNVELVYQENASDDEVRRNVASACARGLPELAKREPNDKAVCIVGGGPSLVETLPLLKGLKQAGARVWALNGAHDWLWDRGIYPDAAWLVDSRPHNAKFFRRPPWDTVYYIASRCHPLVFDTLLANGGEIGGVCIKLWHCHSTMDLTPDAKLIIAGGGTVGLKAISGAFALGYRRIHLFGFDSSYTAHQHHAYAQPTNDGEPIYEMEAAGRKFVAAGWMLRQVQDFAELAPVLAKEGCDIVVHGDGLLPWVARDMARQMEAAA